ncbi:hypothetical protein JY651_15450 [Pyxidicoccus parkwayensis]|uniref:Uncharacterized protein n=1 Tax=Pyxidicoccus parkwayensis TaxID=2813578 RepID=A0ABX7P709_9BACT|nr:hypothetical protein [Pyxidicoccus parkwaysis]QSQ26237.1 hypothetical protein JY651_15450 [Pyxidicoccus parkwaysis]
MTDRNPDLKAAPAPASEARPKYEPPAILWEQPFVALAQISQCNIPGESECMP